MDPQKGYIKVSEAVRKEERSLGVSAASADPARDALPMGEGGWQTSGVGAVSFVLWESIFAR